MSERVNRRRQVLLTETDEQWIERMTKEHGSASAYFRFLLRAHRESRKARVN